MFLNLLDSISGMWALLSTPRTPDIIARVNHAIQYPATAGHPAATRRTTLEGRKTMALEDAIRELTEQINSLQTSVMKNTAALLGGSAPPAAAPTQAPEKPKRGRAAAAPAAVAPAPNPATLNDIRAGLAAWPRDEIIATIKKFGGASGKIGDVPESKWAAMLEEVNARNAAPVGDDLDSDDNDPLG